MTDAEAEALAERLTRKAAEGCCVDDEWPAHACALHESFFDGCDAMWRALEPTECPHGVLIASEMCAQCPEDDPWGSPIRPVYITREQIEEQVYISELPPRCSSG
jgi:hypothetical protein